MAHFRYSHSDNNLFSLLRKFAKDTEYVEMSGKICTAKTCLDRTENHWRLWIGQSKQRGIFEPTEKTNENWVCVAPKDLSVSGELSENNCILHSTETFLNVLHIRCTCECEHGPFQTNCLYKLYFALVRDPKK